MGRASVVIVGAGPAGVAAAVQCRRLGMTPLLLDSDGEAGGLLINGFLVENYPGLSAPVSGSTLARSFAEHLDRFALFVTKAMVHRIEPCTEGGYTLSTSQGEIECDNVIFAGGTRAVPVTFEGSEMLREHRLLLDDLRPFLKGHLPWPQKAAVVGGGEAALDYALSLSERGCHVDVLVRSTQLRGNERLSALIAAQPRITVHYNLRVSSGSAIDQRVALNLQDLSRSESFPVEISALNRVIGAIGRRSRIDEVLPSIAVGTGEISLTPLPGLFICGDARLGGLGQVGIAVGDGLLAAMRVHERSSGGGGRR